MTLRLAFSPLRRACAVMLVAIATIIPAYCPTAATAADATPPVADAASKSAARIAVQVTGRVKNAGEYSLADGARLSDALAAAGAFPAVPGPGDTTPLVDAVRGCTAGESDLHRVYLVRASTTSASQHLAYQIDVANARDRHDVRYDPLLRNDDKIIVPECRPPLIAWPRPR